MVSLFDMNLVLALAVEMCPGQRQTSQTVENSQACPSEEKNKILFVFYRAGLRHSKAYLYTIRANNRRSDLRVFNIKRQKTILL